MKTYYPATESWMASFPKREIDSIWEKYLSKHGEPSKTKGVEEIEWHSLIEVLRSHDIKKIEMIIDKLAQGYFLLIKRVLDENDLHQLNVNFSNFMNSEPSSFHKIHDGVPNFWRDITEELSTRYAVPQVKKTSYWFHWNEASKDVYRLIMPIYRALKALGGKSPTEYENNIPSTGKVDRIQLVHYPAGTGKLDAHHDPKESQRLIMSGYTTRRGVHFEGGGFWAQGINGEKIDMEPFLFPGDFGTCYANIVHGVDATNSGDRGFIGLYTVDSDYTAQRDTIRAASTS